VFGGICDWRCTATGPHTSPCIVEAERPVRAASTHCGVVIVVIVVPVVLPPAFTTNLVGTALGERRVTTRRAGIGRVTARREHAAHAHVRLEPSRPLRDELLVTRFGSSFGPRTTSGMSETVADNVQFKRPNSPPRGGVQQHGVLRDATPGLFSCSTPGVISQAVSESLPERHSGHAVRANASPTLRRHDTLARARHRPRPTTPRNVFDAPNCAGTRATKAVPP
jgi:hypothetical protein